MRYTLCGSPRVGPKDVPWSMNELAGVATSNTGYVVDGSIRPASSLVEGLTGLGNKMETRVAFCAEGQKLVKGLRYP